MVDEDKVKLAQDILEATDKHISSYAKQQAIAFFEWADTEAYRNASNLWKIKEDNFKGTYTTEQVYEKFLQSQSK